MINDKHPIQKLLDEREQTAEVASAERARHQARLDEAWLAVAILMAEAVARANDVLHKNQTFVSFKFIAPTEEDAPRLEIYDDVELDPPTFKLSLDLDAIPEPAVLARGDHATFRAIFSNLDQLLTEIYADFSQEF